MKKINSIILLAFSLVFLLTACVSEEDMKALDPNSDEMIIFEVPAGSTAKRVAKDLKTEGLIKSNAAFVFYLKDNNLSEKLKAGKYELSSSMDIAAIAKKITDGDVYTETVKVLIPEGYEFNMIADKLVESMNIDKDKFIELANTYDFKQKFMEYLPEYDANSGVKYRLEGYLFPATYTFKKSATELDILNAMLDRFDKEITDEYYKKLENNEFDLAQTITLASIIEREGASYDEFPKIAGVFMNRVEKGMLFQSCATVQYIIEERKPRLSSSDIKIDSPYNTYKYAGLPPSPIACPGSVAIKSAFNPEQHDYYYFVVSGNNDGHHIFSKTLAEHNKAVKKALGN